MQPGWMKPTLIKAHRWIGLILAPLFLLIALTGAVLAFKPIVEPPQPVGEGADSATIDVSRVTALLERLDPEGKAIQSVNLDAGAGLVTLRARDKALQSRYALATGEPVERASQSHPFDLFETAEKLHKELLIGFDFPVQLASYLMLAIIIAGPFLAWPRIRNNLMGWHRAAGWLLLPLVVMLPLSGVLMSLHVGSPELPRMSQPGLSLPLSAALRSAARNHDLSHLTMARRFHGGSVLISLDDPAGEKVLAVTDRSVTPLKAGGNLVKQIHEGTWGGALSGSLNLLGAVALSLLTLTGFISWARRARQSRRDTSAADADILIAYASQTGTAARLAQTSLEVLKQAGARVAMASLNSLLPQQMLGYRHNLLLVSTTGEGDLPDTAQAFLRSLDDSHLSGGRFTMLALGDRRYRHFCGGAERLRSALITAGATETHPMQRVDGKPDTGWQSWLVGIAESLKLSVDLTVHRRPDETFKVTLLERQRLDSPADDGRSHPSYRLLLQADKARQFQAGDLLQILPEGEARARSYSIGSSAEFTSDLIWLTVSLHQWRDAQGTLHTGKVSGMLCRDSQLGDQFTTRLCRHPEFHAPQDIGRPLILIASGCGLAPFMGFLEQREYSVGAGPVWLLFGNRWHEVDYLYRERLESLQAMGVITRLDTAFSRDQKTRRYVTHCMREAGDELVRWLLKEDAALYVCGRGSTLGQGVDEALHEILEMHTPHDDDTVSSLIATWSANGKLRRDLFD
jgi:sulfite reductase (NADPH) flavoprotein alpha-component